MLCRICENSDDFAKSHVIPEAFFRALRVGGSSPLLISEIENHFPKRAPIGVYDETIVCKLCEAKYFNKPDAYGSEILINKRDSLFKPFYNGINLVGFISGEVNQKLLAQFLISILWRASVSSQDFYSRINLGQYEKVAKNLILNPDAPIPSCFSSVLRCWNVNDENASLSNSIIAPFKEKLNGVNSYRFYLGRVVAYIKVDNRPLPIPFCEAALQSQANTILVAGDFEKSKDLTAMREIAIASHLNIMRAKTT